MTIQSKQDIIALKAIGRIVALTLQAMIDALEDFEGSVIIVTHSELILRRLVPDQLILCGPDKQTVFLGNYDEFLEKIGWEEEEKKVVKPAKNSAPRPVKTKSSSAALWEKKIIS